MCGGVRVLGVQGGSCHGAKSCSGAEPLSLPRLRLRRARVPPHREDRVGPRSPGAGQGSPRGQALMGAWLPRAGLRKHRWTPG